LQHSPNQHSKSESKNKMFASSLQENNSDSGASVSRSTSSERRPTNNYTHLQNLSKKYLLPLLLG
jgi:hypothetical protein